MTGDPLAPDASRVQPVPQSRGVTTGLLRRGGTPQADQDLVLAMLSWCSRQFGVPRPRFVRHLDGDTWIVQTIVQDKIVVQPADWAEVAMTWTVGLARRPVRVTRPRISVAGVEGVRPIAVTNYIGIPVLCQDQLLGIIEMAGQLKDDIELALARAEERIGRFAERLIYDVSLRADPLITPETECEISGGLATIDGILLTSEEWDFVLALSRPMRIEQVAAASGIRDDRIAEVASALVRRGLIALRTPTRLLGTSPFESRHDSQTPYVR